MPEVIRHFIIILIFNNMAYKNNISFIFFCSVFIFSSTGFLNIPFLQNGFTLEPFLLFLVFILLIIQFAKDKIIPVYKFLEIVFMLFVIYVVIKNIALKNFDIPSISYFLFPLILCDGLKMFFTNNNILNCPRVLKWSIAIILLTYLLFALYLYYIEKETLTNFFIPNKSIFSILLASQIAFILPLYYKKDNNSFKLVNWFFSVVIIGALLLLGLTNGRAGWLGLILAVVYIVYQYLSNPKIKKIILYFLLPFLALVFALLLSYKSDSSNGRMLIYKVSAGMLKDNWLWGIGNGQFKVQYNQYQAAYFASHNIDSKEALLADNTFFAFNDFLQAVIENGVAAFLFLVVILFLLMVQIKKAITNADNKHLFTAATASLICIITGSLVSYPLQIFPATVQATLCIATINSFPSASKQQINLSEIGKKITQSVLLLISILLVVHFCFYYSYKSKSNQAFQLKRAGFKQKAIKKYTALYTSYINEGDALYSYAQELYYSNQLQLAQEVINKAKRYYSSNDVYKLSAAIEAELQNYVQAEKDYKTAVYMVPNRMISRKNLLDFYLERKDTANAIYWTNSIMNMPVKINSEITKNIQQKTREILLQLRK
jgi:O-antigen ligase